MKLTLRLLLLTCVFQVACAPSMFEAANPHSTGSTDGSSTLGGGGAQNFDKPNAPWALMNANQVFNSMLNVSGQTGAVTTNQSAEFMTRKGILSNNDNLNNQSAPLQLATTSLAGTVCDGLLTKEAAAGAVRKYFVNVNFAQAQALNGTRPSVFDDSIRSMANGFWGRNPTAAEGQIFADYYQSFVSSSVAAERDTRDLYLSVCSAMLASVDANTF